MKMRRREDEKMFLQTLLEEPCAQTLSGKKNTRHFFWAWTNFWVHVEFSEACNPSAA